MLIIIVKTITLRNHLNPEETIQISQNLYVKSSFAIHWDTFVLSQEDVEEHISHLRKSLKRKLLSENQFKILNHGQSIFID